MERSLHPFSWSFCAYFDVVILSLFLPGPYSTVLLCTDAGVIGEDYSGCSFVLGCSLAKNCGASSNQARILIRLDMTIQTLP